MESETREPREEAAQEQAQPGPAVPEETPVATVDTPIATPVPKRGVLTRRLFILGGFWTTLGLALVGLLGSPLDFAWPRKGIAGAARKVRVSAGDIPEPGSDPVTNAEGRFFLVRLEEGFGLQNGVTPNGEEGQPGLLALWRKCPHLGCTVPWRPDFTFLGRTGWFRCPCHGSTYTKEGGVLVSGPAPRPMDRFPIEVNDDGSIVVTVGVNVAEKGGTDNPSKTVPYEA